MIREFKRFTNEEGGLLMISYKVLLTYTFLYFIWHAHCVITFHTFPTETRPDKHPAYSSYRNCHPYQE